MNRFEQTTLWQKTLAKQLEPDVYEKERDLLRVQFESFRERAKLLSAEIHRVLPEFTVHDITHLDALWETAELVTKDHFNLTPAEAFVLGGTFLVHDLGMGLASFPKGVDELKAEPIWKDTVASLLKEKLGRPVRENDFKSIDSSIEEKATETVLRLLHAKQAEKLALISWMNKKNETLFLIENTELRESYGSTIGLVSHSHWWTVDELESKLPKPQGAPGILPPDWTVDSIKLACILRIADATQIDDRRAPSFLRTIRKPSKFSDEHWNFQQKLYQPRLEKNRLVYTSKSSFSSEEIESWWICHDTLQMIDNELKEVDSLLTDTNRPRLNAIGVASIEDPKRLSRLITVDGWQPIDTKIKVSNVARLVNTLGGEQLYGSNAIVPLRELIQNASDAVRARRILEKEPESFGSIKVRFSQDSHGPYIEVEDNGVGMSPKVLTGPFLDFGQSFWGTQLMHEELPGLESNGFASTGKYGVGFFSVFMWGDKVTVTSKRYDDARANTLVLEFGKGATSRPVLKKATTSQFIKDGGTRIRVWLSNENTLQDILAFKTRKQQDPIELLQYLCPSLDCDISIEEENKKPTTAVQANDWITLAPSDFAKRLIGNKTFKKLCKNNQSVIDLVTNNLTLIKDEDGVVFGRASLYKEEWGISEEINNLIEGIVTIGGFKSSTITGITGILVGKSHRASRDIGVPILPDNILAKWATNQASLLAPFMLEESIQMACAAVVRYCGGATGELKIAYHNDIAVNYAEIKQIILDTKQENYIILHDAAVSLYRRDNLGEIIFNENVFWIGMGTPGVLQTGHHDIHPDWPGLSWKNQSLESLLFEAFAEAWGITVEALAIPPKRSKKKFLVGYVNAEEVHFSGCSIIKHPSK